jgi:hypothetical protein
LFTPFPSSDHATWELAISASTSATRIFATLLAIDRPAAFIAAFPSIRPRIARVATLSYKAA